MHNLPGLCRCDVAGRGVGGGGWEGGGRGRGVRFPHEHGGRPRKGSIVIRTITTGKFWSVPKEIKGTCCRARCGSYTVGGGGEK